MRTEQPEDPWTRELMLKVLDGEASAAEEARLESIFGHQPDARRLFSATRKVCDQLDRLAAQEPPAGFAADVMRQVRAAPVPATAPVRAFGGRSAVRRNLLIGWSAAAAVVIGFAIYPFLSHQAPSPVDETHAAAAIAPSATERKASSWPVLVRSSGTVGPSLVVRGSGSQLFVTAELDSKRPATLFWSERLELIAPLPEGPSTQKGSARFDSVPEGLFFRYLGDTPVQGSIAVEQNGVRTEVSLSAD